MEYYSSKLLCIHNASEGSSKKLMQELVVAGSQIPCLISYQN